MKTIHGRAIMRVLALAIVLAARAGAFASEHDHAEEGRDARHDEHEDGESAAHPFLVEDFERFGVTVATAGPAEVDPGVELPGEVRPDADRLAHVPARYAGIAREVLVRVGDGVRAGQVLATVESETLAMFEIRAAFDGTVIDRHVAPGEAVSRDRPAFVIGDLSSVWVDVAVYQSALPEIHVGQPVVVTAGAGPMEATGTVSYLSPVVDQATRTARARVVLLNPDGRWRPGMFVTATVLDPTSVPVGVPRRALQRLDGRLVVFVVDGKGFAPRPIVVGRSGHTTVEITSGLAAGERFADQRSFLVKAELGKPAGGHDH